MIASVGLTIRGSLRSSTRTSPGAYMTAPRISDHLLGPSVNESPLSQVVPRLLASFASCHSPGCLPESQDDTASGRPKEKAFPRNGRPRTHLSPAQPTRLGNNDNPDEQQNH